MYLSEELYTPCDTTYTHEIPHGSFSSYSICRHLEADTFTHTRGSVCVCVCRSVGRWTKNFVIALAAIDDDILFSSSSSSSFLIFQHIFFFSFCVPLVLCSLCVKCFSTSFELVSLFTANRDFFPYMINFV